MDHMGVYLTDSANKTVELPVAPSEFKLKREFGGDTMTVLGIGEVRQLGLSKLRSISIPCNLPLRPKDSPWTTAEKLLDSSNDYLTFLNSILDAKKPIRLVLSGTNLNMTALLTALEYGPGKGSTVETEYMLDFTEYREIKALKTVVKVVAKKKYVAPKPKPRPAPPKKIGIGSTVIVNGRLHRDSYGSGPGQTEHNATRKINFHAPGRKCPWHVTTLSGGWRGWVEASAVKAK